MKKNKTTFAKGNKGRPKGSINKNGKYITELRKLALNDCLEAYAELRQAMKNGEGWAHQIFFKQLLPQKAYSESITIELEDTTAETRALEITKQLANITELTYDEAIVELKVFNALKEKEAEILENRIGAKIIIHPKPRPESGIEE
jgi:hypothetical protein